jgi:hypothetical protein
MTRIGIQTVTEYLDSVLIQGELLGFKNKETERETDRESEKGRERERGKQERGGREIGGREIHRQTEKNTQTDKDKYRQRQRLTETKRQTDRNFKHYFFYNFRISYEEEFCSGSGQRGLIYIGDSVGAHFHVPPVWYNLILTSSSY